MTRTLRWLVVALAVAACDAEPIAPPPDGRFVVQAYLYAGEPVHDVRVTGTLPVGATESVAPPINNAVVTLIRNGSRFPLVPTPGALGYYHHAGTHLTVAAGDVFDLEVTVDAVTATGRTVVPPPPVDVSLSPEMVGVDRFWPAEPIVVRWPNPGRAWYFVTHQNVEDDPEPILEGTIIIRPGLIVSEPTTADSVVLPVFTIRHFGRYRVRVHRVNDEYVQLYMSLRQDTRDLNEPATNIRNGYGIFTAFNRSSAEFTVSK
jgi:hypothetical protein